MVIIIIIFCTTNITDVRDHAYFLSEFLRIILVLELVFCSDSHHLGVSPHQVRTIKIYIELSGGERGDVELILRNETNPNVAFLSCYSFRTKINDCPVLKILDMTENN